MCAEPSVSTFVDKYASIATKGGLEIDAKRSRWNHSFSLNAVLAHSSRVISNHPRRGRGCFGVEEMEWRRLLERLDDENNEHSEPELLACSFIPRGSE
jgi:uncharacterized protein (DUF1778 family)